jgi:DNA processing protein
LLLSEALMGEEPVARSFPKRNRIVAGLSAGVVLVEAAERSGSLITARMALEQGREAMAVPGSPLDARAAGCNALIREGAALIRSAADVIEALGQPRERRPMAQAALAFEPSAAIPRPAPRPVADDPVERVAALLGPTPIGFDTLAREAGLPAEALSAALLDLDLAGRIARLPGDMVALSPG